MPSHSTDNWIIYDGDCPFCSNYMKLAKLRENIGPVKIINARDGGPEVETIKAQGIDLDEGFVLHYQGQLYHGPDCIHKMTELLGEEGLFNRINNLIFRSSKRSECLYPFLRAGRNAALKLLGRKKIN